VGFTLVHCACPDARPLHAVFTGPNPGSIHLRLTGPSGWAWGDLFLHHPLGHDYILLRNRIGRGAFRAIHVLSLVGYIGVTLHGYYSGTDTALPSMQILYKVTGLAVLFLTVYWLVQLGMRQC